MSNAVPYIATLSIAAFWGIDQTTLMTAILVPAVLAIFGALLAVWLPRRMPDRLRVKVVPKLKESQFQELSALYCNRVPDNERVPPSHFQAFFRREHSAKSIRDFKRRIRRAGTPVHLLLVARTSTGICGFLKAIFIPDLHSLFIAYLVTAPPRDREERLVAQALISSLHSACRRTAVRSIIYEICSERRSSHKAKARLFCHYATSLKVKLRRIAAKYQQPEICSFDAGDCKLTSAELYIAYLNDTARSAWHSMPRSEYEEMVSAIYRNVYLMSYALAEPPLTEKYRDFLQRVMRNLRASVKGATIELK